MRPATRYLDEFRISEILLSPNSWTDKTHHREDQCGHLAVAAPRLELARR